MKRAINHFVIHILLGMGALAAQGAVLGLGPAVQDGDPYPYTQTITESLESFNVQMNGTAENNTNTHLYVSAFNDWLGIMESPGATNNASDYRQINPDEELHMSFSNIPSGKRVKMTALNGYGGSYFPEGVELHLSKNGQLVETIYCDGSSSYILTTPIYAGNGDTISFNPSGNVRLYNFTVTIANSPDSTEPYISNSISSTNLFTQTITEPGHYYVTADWSGLTHKPDGVLVRVSDPLVGEFRFLGHTGPNVGTLDLDLLVLNPGDTVKVYGGLTGNAGEDPGLWTLTLTKYDSWSTSRYTPAVVPWALASPLDSLDLHKNLWPKHSLFRGEFEGFDGYTRFWNSVNEALGHAPKCFGEERDFFIQLLPLMQRYTEENPDRQALVHWNGDNIKLDYQDELPGGADQFKPYHMKYYTGSYLSADVTASSTHFTVYDASPFEVGVKDLAIIIPVDPVTGERDFDQCELVRITAISGNELTVERNAFGSTFGTTAKSYNAGAYLAPGIRPHWSADSPYYHNAFLFDKSHTDFRYNLSVYCPRDSSGRNGGDVLADMLSSSFETGGELERFHGIMFDVLFRNKNSPSVDANLDGLADGGLDPRGLDLTHLGSYGFAVKLRNALPGRILTFDGNGPDWPGLHRLFSGMESEGFCHYNDAYNKDWGSALNWWQYTKQWNASEYPYTFCIPKVKDLDDGVDRRPFDLMNNAAGCILGITMLHTPAIDPDGTQYVDDRHAYDEFRRGQDKVYQWLGAPVSDIIRPSLSSPDVLSGAGLPAAGWTPGEGTTSVTAEPEGIRISGDATDYSSTATMSASYSGITIPEGDLVIRFEAMGDGFTHFPADVARYIEITVDGRQASDWNYETQKAIFTTDGFTENAVFYRGAGAPGGSTVTLNLTIEGTGDVLLKNFSVHNATDVLLREFSHGAVLCNPSENPYTFDLASYFPGQSFIRLQGQSYDDPITNDGSAVVDTVQLDEHSGLFLRKVENEIKVIRFDRSGETQSVGSRNVDVSKPYGATWSFSDTAPLISSADGTNATVYGGAINSWSVATSYDPQLRFLTSEFQNQVFPDNGSDTTAKGLLVWKKEDFLNGTSTQAVSLASGGNLSCAITVAAGNFEGRFVVKQEGIYFVSETAATDTGEFNIYASSTDWAPVNVTDYSIGTYKPRLFTDVEAVGLYYSITNSGYQSLLKFSNFDLTVPEAAVYDTSAVDRKTIALGESNDVEVSWFGVYGVNYRLQESSNLVEGIWNDVGEDVYGLGDWMTLSSSTSNTGFFRTFSD